MSPPTSPGTSDYPFLTPVPLYGNSSSPIMGLSRICVPNNTFLACHQGVYTCITLHNQSCTLVSLLPNLPVLPGATLHSYEDFLAALLCSPMAIPFLVSLLAVSGAARGTTVVGMSQVHDQGQTQQLTVDFSALSQSWPCSTSWLHWPQWSSKAGAGSTCSWPSKGNSASSYRRNISKLMSQGWSMKL